MSICTKIFILYLGGYIMDTLFMVMFGLLMIKLAEEVMVGLHNTHQYNHVDDYWMVPALCIFAIGTFMLLV